MFSFGLSSLNDYEASHSTLCSSYESPPVTIFTMLDRNIWLAPWFWSVIQEVLGDFCCTSITHWCISDMSPSGQPQLSLTFRKALIVDSSRLQYHLLSTNPAIKWNTGHQSGAQWVISKFQNVSIKRCRCHYVLHSRDSMVRSMVRIFFKHYMPGWPALDAANQWSPPWIIPSITHWSPSIWHPNLLKFEL